MTGYVTAVVSGLAIAGVDDGANALDPRGGEAARIAWIWWLMFGLGLAVYLVVLVLLVAALGRRGERDERGVEDRDEHRDDETADGVRTQRLITMGGIALPAVVLALLTTVGALPGIRSDGPTDLTIEVEGRQFWWHVRYPDDDVVTANEIRIPVGQPVELLLTSSDVIHSLWVPQLAGKLDLVPGRTNRLVIEADQPGTYRAMCAEFCGIAHAHMRLVVIAAEPDEHARWVAAQSRSAPEPATARTVRGRDVFLGSCAYCHTVKGTNATSDVGPDLTHLMSRPEIGAGVFANDPEQLAEWIRSNQRHKPGNLMPDIALDDDDLSDLIAWLETLR